MANNHFLASYYRFQAGGSIAQNANALFSTAGNVTPAYSGITKSFPSAGVDISPAPDGYTANGVTMHSIISVHPTGLNQKPDKYWSDATVATLNTAAT